MPEGPPKAAHLFLGWRGLSALPVFLATLPAFPTRAAFVVSPLAAPEARAAADAGMRLLAAAGIRVDPLDLRRTAYGALRHLIANVGLVWVADGPPWALLEEIRASGFASLIAAPVAEGRLAYVGMGAGAALAGPDPSAWPFAEDPGAPADRAGLALVPFTVLPGAAGAPRDGSAPDGDAAVRITDREAVLVGAGAWQVRESV